MLGRKRRACRAKRRARAVVSQNSPAELAGAQPGDVIVHDAHSPDPTMAFAISRLTDAGYLNTSPIGIFRQVERATYDDAAREQVASASASNDDTADQSAQLAALIGGGDTWTII